MLMGENRIQTLVGEDNFAELKLFEIAAQESGLLTMTNIDAATDGEEVINKLTQAVQQQRPYELLVLDLNMPRVSGIMVLHYLQHTPIHPKPFIIILTNSDNPVDKTACMEYGADLYLQKPADFYEMESFCRVLKNCMELNKGLDTEFIRMNYNGVH
jgi:CheY-like chemotaxis protein